MSSLKNITVIIAISAMFVEYIDSTIIMTALPTLAHVFNINMSSTKLIICIYFLGLGPFIPMCSWLSDTFGSKFIFCVSILLFVIGSLFCALSQTFLFFLFARFIQGIAGAMMVPIARIIVFQSIKKTDYLKVISLLTIPALIGPILGPVLGGYIITYYDWRWIFLINIPAGCLGLLAAHFFIKNKKRKVHYMDWRGLILLSTGFTLTIISLLLIDGLLISIFYCGIALFIGLLLIYLYYKHAKKYLSKDLSPLIDIKFFNILTFRIGIISSVSFRMGLASIPFIFPIFLQERLGFTPFIAGAMMTSSAIGGILMKTFAPNIICIYGYKKVLLLNAYIISTVVFMGGFIEIYTFIPLIILNLFLIGFLSSLQFTGLNSMLYADISRRDISQVSNIASIIQQLAPCLGIAIIGMVLNLSKTINNSSSAKDSNFIPIFIAISFLLFISTFLIRKLSIKSCQNMIN